MDKNTILLGIVILTIGLVSMLFLFSPHERLRIPETSSEVEYSSIPQKNNIEITYNKKNLKQQQFINKNKKDDKNNRSIIVASTVDHYKNYYIQILDKNRKKERYKKFARITGKVNGKYFVLNIPKKIVDDPNLKLKIINLNTKKTTVFDADFLSEIAGTPDRTRYYMEIDLKNKNISTKVKLPPRVPANPPIE